MGTLYDEDEEIEESLTDEQAKRLTEWGGSEWAHQGRSIPRW